MASDLTPTLRAPAELWRFASVVVTYGARHRPMPPTLGAPAWPQASVAVDYASWTKGEDGGCAVVVEEVGVGEGLERDFLGWALARAAWVGLAEYDDDPHAGFAEVGAERGGGDC